MSINNILSQDAFWIINKQIAKKYGIESTLLLSDLISKYEYFKSFDMLVDEDWLFNTSTNIELDTSLTYHKQKACIKILENAGFIETKLMGVPAKLHFKILENKIWNFLNTGIGKTLNLYNKNKPNNNKQVVTDKKKSVDTVYSLFKNEFMDYFKIMSETDYYFTGKDGAKIKSLITKIKHAYKSSGVLNATDQQMLDGFKHILDRAKSDSWLMNNFTLSNIDSQFNKLKLKSNGKQTNNNRDELARQMEEVLSKSQNC